MRGMYRLTSRELLVCLLDGTDLLLEDIKINEATSQAANARKGEVEHNIKDRPIDAYFTGTRNLVDYSTSSSTSLVG